MVSLLSILSQSAAQDGDWPQLQKDLEYAMRHRAYLKKYPLVLGLKACGVGFLLASFAYIIYFSCMIKEQLQLQKIAQEDLIVSVALGSYLLAPFLGMLAVYLLISVKITASNWDNYFQLLKKWDRNNNFRQEYDIKKQAVEKFEKIQLHVMGELKNLSSNDLEQYLNNPLVQPWALKMIKEEWVNRAHKV